MERKKVTELANQARSGGRALWARSSDPGIPKEGSALPARRDRAPPGPGFLAVKLQCERVAQLRSPRTCGRRSDWRRLERSPLQDCAARVGGSRDVWRPEDPAPLSGGRTRSGFAPCTLSSLIFFPLHICFASAACTPPGLHCPSSAPG